MSDTIVVGVTGAPVAARAVDWAVQRAAAQGHNLLLVSVVGGAIGAVGEGEVIAHALATAQALLDAEVARVGDRGVVISTRVDRGKPVAQLIKASADASLLVIGSDYRGPGSGPARGAHGVSIVAGAACPVVVVPDVETAGRTGVVVGVDGSSASENAIRFAAAEADRLDEPLIAISAWTPLEAPRRMGAYPVEYLTNMQTLTEERLALSLAGLRRDYPDLVLRELSEQGYPSAILNEHAESARMMVLGSHGRGAIARFLLGSIGEEVIQRLATVTAVVR